MHLQNPETMMRKARAPYPEPRSADPDVIREWIKDICRQAGITTTELAREASLAASTLNRFVNARDGTPENIGGTTLHKLRDAASKVVKTK